MRVHCGSFLQALVTNKKEKLTYITKRRILTQAGYRAEISESEAP